MSVPTPKRDAALARLADERRYGVVTVANLREGEAVQNNRGALGEVVAFDRDHVTIRWTGELGLVVSTIGYTDAELVEHGITRWSPIQRVSR